MVTSILPVSLLDSPPIPTLRSQRLASLTASRSEDVLVRAQAGDPDAFSQLYLLHKKRVYTICMQMVHDCSLAEDLTQETFLQLHRKLTSFRGESAFTTWLHRMTFNIVLQRLRKRVLPVVSLDQMMTDIPEERTRHGAHCAGLFLLKQAVRRTEPEAPDESGSRQLLRRSDASRVGRGRIRLDDLIKKISSGYAIVSHYAQFGEPALP